MYFISYRLRTPPSRDAFRHSGGASLLCTSATVTLYFDVELNNDKRPGTEQNTSAGVVTIAKPSLLLISRALIPKILYDNIKQKPNKNTHYSRFTL